MSQSSEFTTMTDDIAFNSTQQLLREALTNRDLADFAIALDMGADPLSPDDQHICVYELALSTYGCADFVHDCLKNGCSPHYINHHLSKAAINFAADSGDPRIFRRLLANPDIMVNHAYNHLTPLNCLARKVTNDNADDIIGCVECLLDCGASVWIPDQSQKTPKQHVEENRNLSEEKKRLILQSCALLVDLPLIHSSPGEAILLKRFLDSIRHSDNISFELLLEEGVDCNGTWDGITPLYRALSSGNSYALRRLLMRLDLQIAAVKCPLKLAICKMREEPGDHRKCFYMLLASKRIDINECDETGCTALHSAVVQRNDEAVRELLKRGASLGAKNTANILALDGMNAELRKECFDNCVTSNGFKMGDTDFEICMNYENLISHTNQPKFEEMPTIAFIVQSKEYRHLIYHPLIISFLLLKWRQLCVLFYADFVLIVFFTVSVISHTVLKFNDSADKGIAIAVFGVMSWIGVVGLIIRECLQMAILPRKYFLSKSNYMELTMIVLAILTCTETSIDQQTQRILAVCLLLLVAVELFVILGGLPAHSISTHMLMFKVVCISFLKSFALYSIFVVTFSFCFFILLGGRREGQAASQGEQGEDFQKFTNPLASIVKTILMLTGEFDAGAMEFRTVYSYMLFLLFVFLMTMVLYNLLNGLAVSDIQAIKGQAKHSGALGSINFLTRYERLLSDHSERQIFSVNVERFQPLVRRLMHRHPGDNGRTMWRDTENNKADTKSNIGDRRIIKLAMTILEEKTINSRRQQRMRNNENRFNNIDKRLGEIYEIIENIP